MQDESAMLSTASVSSSLLHTGRVVLVPLFVVKYFYPILRAALNLMGSEGLSTMVSVCVCVPVIYHAPALSLCSSHPPGLRRWTHHCDDSCGMLRSDWLAARCSSNQHPGCVWEVSLC